MIQQPYKPVSKIKVNLPHAWLEELGGLLIRDRVRSLKPIIDDQSRVLILGSIPSAMSIEKQEYYANKGNHFWRAIYAIFDSELDSSYVERISFLRGKGVALWDVLKECNREGGIDPTITGRVPNDFASLFEEYPGIKFVFFNGRMAEKSFEKLVRLNPNSRLKLKRLPSTSSANARLTIEAKVEEWRTVRECLERCD